MKNKIAAYHDVKSMPSEDCGEKFVYVDRYDSSIKSSSGYSMNSNGTTSDAFEGRIVVRQTVAEMLARTNRELKKINKNFVLCVSYGYRSFESQKKRYVEAYDNCDIKDKTERREFVHEKIASPDIAGHPTGGVVDLTIYNIDKEEFVDMGCKISDFTKQNYNTYAESITSEQLSSRLVLHDTMVEQGFFPYYNEWWHFGYGDKEWAFFYNKKSALYEQVERDKVSAELVLDI